MKMEMKSGRAIGQRRGLALLTVVALLSLFAVLGTAFTLTMRLEIQSARNFQKMARIREVASVGAVVAKASLRGDSVGMDGIPNSGDEYNYYDSEKSNWYLGFSNELDSDSQYIARSRVGVIDPRTKGRNPLGIASTIDLLEQGTANRLMHLGFDEDPPGDLNGDGFPGIAKGTDLRGIIFDGDDDGDGYADFEDPDVLNADYNGNGVPLVGYDGILGTPDDDPADRILALNDDDEDGRADEDGPDSFGLNGALVSSLPPGEGLDLDDDRLGVEDESAKININVVGNLSTSQGRVYVSGPHRYNQGATTFEIDPTLYFMARGVPTQTALLMTQNLIYYRNGSLVGVNQLAAPGTNAVDDNFNSAENTSLTGAQTFSPGNYFLDADGDGVYEPHELTLERDGIDNDGDGKIDELQTEDDYNRPEGFDEPSEFDPVSPYGDDNPIDVLEELKRLDGFNTVIGENPITGQQLTLYDLVKDYLTVYSNSPIANPAYMGSEAEEQYGLDMPVNINQLSSIYEEVGAQLSPSDLFALVQIDNDGDWDPNTDDYNGNGRPDADWDGSFAVAGSDGRDNDNDGVIDDDDEGDFNQDGVDGYDPEYHLNEDPPGDNTAIVDLILGRTFIEDNYPTPGISKLDPELADLFREEGDDDEDGDADFEDLEVLAALNPDTRVTDRRDNDWNSRRWLTDGIDNDFDGLIDETREDEIAKKGVAPSEARNEGVDETAGESLPQIITDLGLPISPGYALERYYPPFDDDEDGRMDEDPPEFDFLVHLVDSIDTPLPEILGNPADPLYDGLTSLSAPLPHHYSPRQVQDALSKTLGGVGRLLPDKAVEDDKKLFTSVHQYTGSEGLYINEVLVRSVITLQPEFSDNVNFSSQVTQGSGDIVPGFPDADTQFELNTTDGNFYEVSNNSSTAGAPPRVPQPEEAYWEFPAVDFPFGDYNLWVFQDDSGPLDIVDAFITVELYNGGTFIHAASGPLHWSNPGDPYLPQDDPITVNGTNPLRVNRIRIYITIEATEDGRFTFDRVELHNPRVQYIEMANLSNQPLDFEEYQIEMDGGLNGTQLIDSFTTIQSGPLGDTILEPYDPNGSGHICLLVNDPDADAEMIKFAYQNAVDGDSIIPDAGEMTILRVPQIINGFDLFDETDQNPNDYPLIFEDINNSTKTLYLSDSEGNRIDEFEVDFRIKTPNNAGFRPQQRGAPTDAWYWAEKVGPRPGEPALIDVEFRKKLIPAQRLYVSEADLIYAEDDSSPPKAVELFSGDPDDPEDSNWNRYWEMNPEYPGQLAFKFAGTNNTDVKVVLFFFNLSRRFSNLNFDDTNANYFVDVTLGNAPWADQNGVVGQLDLLVQDPSPVSGVPNPILGGTNIPWSDRIDSNAASSVNLRSGEFWRTAEVVRALPGDDPTQDSYLVIPISRPAGPEWQDVKLSYVEISPHGSIDQTDDTNGLLELRGGTPGNDNGLRPSQRPVLENQQLAAPGNMIYSSASSPAWLPGATELAELSTRFTTKALSKPSDINRRGMINVNTAPISVLTSLPWAPPELFENNLTLIDRFYIHAAVAARLVEGRSEWDAAGFTLPNIDDDNDGFIDEEPYREISDIFRVLRDPVLKAEIENIVRPKYDPEFEWNEAQWKSAYARVSNLITTRSNVFTIRSQGRIMDDFEGRPRVSARQGLETTVKRN